MQEYHESVLLREVVEALAVAAGKRYLDATAGDGGHSLGVASAGGNVLAIDQDKEALLRFQKRLETVDPAHRERIKLMAGSFSQIAALANKGGFIPVDGVLFDLGISSHQLFEGKRGFSFNSDEYLDLRMDSSRTMTGADILKNFSEHDLFTLFLRYGEEPHAQEMAQIILKTRRKQPLTTARQLAGIIRSVYAKKGKRPSIDPATRIFQALRIAVNDELGELRKGLRSAVTILKIGGRIAVISFHSLEDRIVKNFMTRTIGLRPLNKKPIVPSWQEISINPRARSAKLRVGIYEAKN